MMDKVRERYADNQVVPDPVTTVTQYGQEVPPASLPASPKRVYNALTAAGWTVKVQRSTTHTSDSYWKSDSEEDGKNSYRRGDVKKPGYDLLHWFMAGGKKGPNGLATFTGAHWQTEDGKTSFKGVGLPGLGYPDKMKTWEDWINEMEKKIR